MIRRRSLNKQKKSKRRSRRRSRRRSQKFGKPKTIELPSELSNDISFKIASNFFNPHKIIELMAYMKNIITNALTRIKPDENIKLGLKERFERWIIGWYKNGIKDFVKNLTPAQVVLLTKGKYNTELSNKLLFRIDPPPVDESKITDFGDISELIFLKTLPGKIIFNSIKNFIESLTPTQLVLLINGKYDLGNAMYNSFLHTKYNTIKKKDLPKIENQMTQKSE